MNIPGLGPLLILLIVGAVVTYGPYVLAGLTVLGVGLWALLEKRRNL